MLIEEILQNSFTLKIDRQLGNGGPRRIRTPNPLIRSQVLYPVELWVRFLWVNALNY